MPEWFWDVVKNLAAGGYDWRLTLLLYAFLIPALVFWLSLREANSRRDLANWVRKRAWKNSYKSGVVGLLNLSDQWFLTSAQRETRETMRPLDWAWSGRLLDRAMLLAVLYPFIILLFQWVWTGDQARIGPYEIVPEEPNETFRAVTFIVFALFVRLAVWLSGEKVEEVLNRGHAKLRLPEIFWGFSTGAIQTGAAFIVVGAVVYAIASLGSTAASIAFLMAALAAISFSKAASFEGAGSAALSYAIGFSIAVAIIFSRQGEGNAIIIASAMVPLLVAGIGSDFIVDEKNSSRFKLSVCLVFLASVVVVGVWYTGSVGQYGAILIVLIAALPIVNAFFDFLSLGVTRYALAWGVKRFSFSTIVVSLGDAFVAALLFLALGCAATVYIHLLNSVAEAPLLELGNLFAEIRQTPGDYWWLYATFLSTLLPTALHLIIALFALGPALLVDPVRKWLANMMETSEAHFLKRLCSVAILSFWMAVVITGPVVLAAWLLQVAHADLPAWGNALVDLFEGFWRWLPGAG